MDWFQVVATVLFGFGAYFLGIREGKKRSQPRFSTDLCTVYPCVKITISSDNLETLNRIKKAHYDQYHPGAWNDREKVVR